MTSSADRIINALRTGHDALASKVVLLSPAALGAASGASEWTVAQVLSHLGSGAEIHTAMLDRQLSGGSEPPPDANQRIWARWDAMSREEQADNFLKTNDLLVERYESLDEQTRATKQIDLGYLPAPVDVATAAGFRLNEFTLHAWDVEVGADPAARLDQEGVEQLLEIVPHMLSWLGKPDVMDGREVTVAVHLTDLGRELGLHVGEGVALDDTPTDATASLALRAESWHRLLFGRLGPEFTPADVVVDGAITLDELRQVFPGI